MVDLIVHTIVVQPLLCDICNLVSEDQSEWAEHRQLHKHDTGHWEGPRSWLRVGIQCTSPQERDCSPLGESGTQMPYKNYSHEALAQAISAVRRNVLSQRAAAAQYGVPRSTLRDGVGQKKKGTQTGQSRMLTDVEERALVTYII
ncbi:hypothetical protein MAR_012774 [Mya arenaria]|uniref:HTH psq-type domain-containing protein n=1 Tax=Mya arenaria TaxID=6604 RepID=A0ABY7FXY3_MYAAR|nr:hypothetical protein MAR_012774 [Mya arenaria]